MNTFRRILRRTSEQRPTRDAEAAETSAAFARVDFLASQSLPPSMQGPDIVALQPAKVPDSKTKRRILSFAIDSGIDVWKLEEFLDRKLGRGDWELQQNLDRYDLLATRDLTQKELVAINGPSVADTYPSDLWFKKLAELTAVLSPVESDSAKPLVKIALISFDGVYSDGVDVAEHISTEGSSSEANTSGGTNLTPIIRKTFGREEVEVLVRNIPHGQEPAAAMVEAIRWAALQSGVNVICIPIGLSQGTPQLRAVVKEAVQRNVLIFASAAMNDQRASIAFPARMRDVFCMFSTDAHLKISDFNPPPSPSIENFAILGEIDRDTSGTSVSAAIASGVAAALLDFAGQPDVGKYTKGELLDKLRTKAGMAKVFKLMSERHRDGGYCCLVPWGFLPPIRGDKQATRELICQRLLYALEY